LPAAADRLFDMYLDPSQHEAFSGSPVTVSAQPSSPFNAFGGQLSGRMLYTVPKTMIVQVWRSTHFKPDDMDSILVLTFTPQGNSGRIDLVHVNVADQDVQGVTEGWKKYYWEPWRRYLERH
jgi:activator of HSP90 ATPase